MRIPNPVVMVILGGVALVATSLPGCTPRGHIRAEGIAPLVSVVSARHDTYVKGDPKLNDAEKRLKLRSTKLLREIVRKAQESAKEP